MSDLPLRLRTFVAELKRRKVIRVAIGYGAVAFALVQVADAAFPALYLPPWTITFVVVLVILGFPVAMLLSWAYDLVPDPGTDRHPDAESAAPERSRTADSREEKRAHGEPVPVLRVRALKDGEEARAPVLNNLPPQSTPFVGRERERREIAGLLRSSSTRLVTITGPGGIGKTRLALEAARASASGFPGGLCFVSLSALDSADSLTSTISECLGLPLSGRENPRLQLLEHLRGERLLLVLDNFEHLTDGAPLLAAILEHAAELKIIVTSRERLNLYGEVLFPLGGLSYPQGGSREAAEDSDAVQLFVQNARALDPNFTPCGEDLSCIVRVAQMVGGFPLAIELASAWTRVLSCAEIVREIQQNHDFLSSSLRDLPDRHKSLRAVFDSSWRLLSANERRVFRRLSIFRGGFTREAAAKVTGADFAVLSALLDKSLVRRTASGRFEIPEVLRQYAEERLQEDALELDSMQRLHCDYYEELLRELHQRLDGAEEKKTLERIGEEIDNIRAAGLWAITHQQIGKLSDLLDGPFVFYDLRGRAREGEEIFRQTAAAVEKQARAGSEAEERARISVLAKATSRRGVFCIRLGLHQKAGELLDKGLSLARELNDRAEIAFALEKLGINAYETGNYLEAQRLFECSLALSRELQNEKAVAQSLGGLGNVAFAQGRYAEAKQWYRESLQIRRKVGDRKGSWVILSNLGSIAGMEEAYSEANQLLQESLAITRELDNRRGIANTLHNLGCVASDLGDYGKAQQYLRECVSICRETSYQPMLASCLTELGNVAQRLAESEEAEAYYRQALAVALPIKRIPLMLEILIGIGELLAEREERERAVELLSLALEHPASDQALRDRADALRRQLEAELPAGRFEDATERGRALDLEDVVTDFPGVARPVVSV